ncbi:MAG: hypothetical protein WKF75_11205 [Singulisphaera sp.]
MTTPTPPPARRDETGEQEVDHQEAPELRRPRSGAPAAESATAPDVLDPARQGRRTGRQIADDRKAAGLRPRAEMPAAGAGADGRRPSLDERIAWFLEVAEDPDEFAKRVVGDGRSHRRPDRRDCRPRGDRSARPRSWLRLRMDVRSLKDFVSTMKWRKYSVMRLDTFDPDVISDLMDQGY